jgi:hypothetical protein
MKQWHCNVEAILPPEDAVRLITSRRNYPSDVREGSSKAVGIDEGFGQT